MKKVKLIAWIVVTVAAIIIALQNTEVMTTRLLFWTVTMSRSLTLLATFVLGVLTGAIGGMLLAKKGDKPR